MFSYIKIGQQIASMTGFIPDEYIEILKVMKDQAPTIPYEDVRKVIFQDFGKPIEELFVEFDPTPLASASLAQVHRAKTKEGRIVAVKVQYPFVRGYLEGDIKTREYSSKLAIRMYYLQEDATTIDEIIDLDAQFANELGSGLKAELDFINEANNAKRAAQNFAYNKFVYVPEIVDELTSKRVLTMEFIDGAVKANDATGMEKLGLNVKQVADLLLSAFAEQQFLHGFLHADPHSSNVFVRRNPKVKNGIEPQIVILDNGLYKELSEDFRYQYSTFWNSVVKGDKEGIKRYCDNLGIHDFELYTSMIMFQSFDRIGEHGVEERPMTAEEFEKMGIKMQNQMETMMNIYRNMPKEMMLISRSDNLLRSINRELGSPVNRFNVMARAAKKFVETYEKDHPYLKPTQKKGVLNTLSQWKDKIFFELRLLYLSIQSWLVQLYVGLIGEEKFRNQMIQNMVKREEVKSE